MMGLLSGPSQQSTEGEDGEGGGKVKEEKRGEESHSLVCSVMANSHSMQRQPDLRTLEYASTLDSLEYWFPVK